MAKATIATTRSNVARMAYLCLLGRAIDTVTSALIAVVGFLAGCASLSMVFGGKG